MAARTVLFLAALLVLAAVPPPARAQAVTAQLVSLSAGYGPEAWKDEAPVGLPLQGLPLPVPVPNGTHPATVYENPYATGTPHQGPRAWLGYNLTANIDIQGAPAGSAYYIRAVIDTPPGKIPAKLSQLSASSFVAQFDLDGDDAGGIPPVQAGNATLKVEVYRASADPTVASVRVGTAEFGLQVLPANLDLGGFQLREGDLPGYAEVGAGNLTTFVPTPVRPGDAFTVNARLGAPDAPARIVAWSGGTGRVLAEARTDAAGFLTATVDAAQLTGGAAGLVLVDAHLDGSLGRLASEVIAVPVSSHPTRIVELTYQPRAVLGQPVSPADMLVAQVEDLAPSTTERAASGTLHVLDATGASVVSVPFNPSGFAPSSNTHEARIPAVQLAGVGQSSYRLLAFLMTPENRLYSLAQATRGLAVGAEGGQTPANQDGAISVTLRNLQTNLDDQRDPGLALVVHVVVSGLPGGDAYETDQTLEEGMARVIQVPFRGTAGDFPLTINATSGELSQGVQTTLRIAAPAKGLPGFEVPLAFLAAGLAGLAVQRRRTSR